MGRGCLVVLLVAAAAVCGCSDPTAEEVTDVGDVAADAADATDVQIDPDGGDLTEDETPPVVCCPIADEPGCDCFAIGGTEANGCSGVCDAAPTGWVLGEDENGCPQWQGGSDESCLEPPNPCNGSVPPGCFAADPGTFTTVAGEQFLVRLPSDSSARADVVVFLPGGMGTLDTASVTYERWIQGGEGEDGVIVVLPYAEDGNLLDEPGRAAELLDRVQACTCNSGVAHLGGTSAGGLAAFSHFLDSADRYQTLLGAPGAFRDADDEVLLSALGGKRVYLGLGGDDAAWSEPVRADYARLMELGVDVVFVEWPGEGHVVSEAFDPTPLFDFWAGR
jgi:hypothetical protein